MIPALATSHAPAGRVRSDTGLPAATVLPGDAFDLLPTLKSESVDLVITSPPYWGHRTYLGSHNWDILAEWKAAKNYDPNSVPSYDWYRKHGGLLGLEPLPEWYIAHLVEILD